jgi:hypothetical protein
MLPLVVAAFILQTVLHGSLTTLGLPQTPPSQVQRDKRISNLNISMSRQLAKGKPAAARAKPAIPLSCNLCIKSPTFSDLSHLLTHISAKTHLSNKFQFQIQAQSDPEAATKLATFDAWFEKYGIGKLLADRVAAKDKDKDGAVKKSSKRNRAPTTVSTSFSK